MHQVLVIIIPPRQDLINLVMTLMSLNVWVLHCVTIDTVFNALELATLTQSWDQLVAVQTHHVVYVVNHFHLDRMDRVLN